MTAYDIGDDEWRNKAFRRMNVKISSNLKESNLEDLRYLFEADGVPLSDLEEANTGIKIFKLLEQRGLYGPHNVKILKDALESLGREDLRKHIIEFESVKVFDEETDGASRRQPGNSVGLPVQQQQPQALMTDNFLKELAKDIGLNWRMLARELELPESEIDGIAHAFPQQLHEQSYQALKKWKVLGGEQGATALVLKRALRKQKLNGIIYKYFETVQ